jgi:hypothetical protein
VRNKIFRGVSYSRPVRERFRPHRVSTRQFFDNRDWYSPPHLIHDLFSPHIEGGLWDKRITNWECAQGDGRLVREMQKLGYKVVGSDIKDGHNFLTMTAKEIREVVGTDTFNVITNPRFELATEFAQRAFEVAYRKVALLLPLQYMNAQNRAHLFDACPGDWKWTGLYPYAFRPKFTRPDGTVGIMCAKPGSSNFDVAWFSWTKLSGPIPDVRVRRIHRPVGERA